MTIRLEGTIKRWVGLSADIKPRPTPTVPGPGGLADEIPPGSSFLESDTGRIYRWNGIEWRAPEEPEDIGPILHSIDARLALLVDLLTGIIRS